MTPKEKAFELAHKFRLIDIRTSESTTMMISMADAKLAALIAVDEILDNFPNEFWDEYLIDNFKYWGEVKKELNNL